MFAETITLDSGLLVAAFVLVVSAGIAIMSWTLTTVVRLANLVARLEERVNGLGQDLDHLRAGHPEVRP